MVDNLNQAKELFLTALQHQNQGDLEQAESCYKQALALVPDRPSVINNLAAVLLQLGRCPEARSWCEKLLAVDSSNVVAMLNLGNCQLAQHSPEAALKCYDDALAIDPRYVEALNSRSKALMDLGRAAEALASCDQALVFQPDNSEVLNNRGGALLDLNRYTEALASYELAVAISPNFAEAHYNRGNVLRNLGRHQDALACYDRAITFKPDCVNAHWNESLCRLLIGDFAQGWQKYEWRWKNEVGRASRRDLPGPWWDGTYVNGVLRAWGEQGLGEQILYASMLEELRKRAKHLVVEVEPRLVPLFRRSFSGIEIVPPTTDHNTTAVDAHVAMGSVGQYLRTRWEDFPSSRTSYLLADQERVKLLRSRWSAEECLVGLSWFSKMNRAGEGKSIPLRHFEPILKLPGMRFIDLQYGDTSEERREVAQLTGVKLKRVADVDCDNDIDSLAALISACDVIVTVSNTTAHLAGALGKPVYLLLPYALPTHWYWHIERDPSPWYPTVRLFRQPAVGEWGAVIRQVAEEVALLNAPRQTSGKSTASA